MKLSYITIMVRDMEKSLQFYQELVGLHIVRQIEPPMGRIVFLGNREGETLLELIDFAAAEKVSTKGLVMSYEAESELAALREKAIALGYEASEIMDCPPKPEHFTVTDPDGIIVEFS